MTEDVEGRGCIAHISSTDRRNAEYGPPKCRVELYNPKDY